MLKRKLMKLIFVFTETVMFLVGCTLGKTSDSDKTVIYTNADEEASKIIEEKLNKTEYKGKYIIQNFGTSELGGKIMAEGESIDADIILMSSYFIDSAQKEYDMFENINYDKKTISSREKYYLPIIANTGAIFYNKDVIQKEKLDIPKSIKDLTKSEYKDNISIPSIMDSSTAWLMIQAIVDNYSEKEQGEIISKITENAGPHIESSGSGPIKKVRAGEVAIGFGLRHQAVEDMKNGKNIGFVDPEEGNFYLTDVLAAVKKDGRTGTSVKIIQSIVNESRKELIELYPVPLYKGEEISEENKAEYPRQFKDKLSVELLEKHQELFNKYKK